MNRAWHQRLSKDDVDDDGICFQQYGSADHDRHATLRYNDVASAGPAARPLDFPAPEVFRGERVNLSARDHKSGRIHHLQNVILRSGNIRKNHSRNDTTMTNTTGCDTAYFETKKISKTVYGCVNLCIVLKRIDRKLTSVESRKKYDNDLSLIEWESTDLQVAIKVSEWKKIHAMRGKHLEDPIKEIAAMQLVGNCHRHVVGAIEVLQDDRYLYTIMPYISGGDLSGRLKNYIGNRSLQSDGSCGNRLVTSFDETSARRWFRQLLLAVNTLQKKGVCHRDICLENILLDEKDNICLIDPGMGLRIPYTDSQTGGVGDVSSGTSRRLVIAQGQGGKLMYAAPEIIARETAIDAFATDLWSVGVVLFVMMVGLAPFRWAHPTDERYARISSGQLESVVKGLGISISPEVCDLLQNFFWADKQKRFTLAQIMQHPWVQGRTFIEDQPPTISSKSKFSFGSHNVFVFDAHNLKNRIRSKKRS